MRGSGPLEAEQGLSPGAALLRTTLALVPRTNRAPDYAKRHVTEQPLTAR